MPYPCQVCEEGCIYPYILSNGEAILICEECDCMWLDFGNPIGSDKCLEDLFRLSSKELFGGVSNWAHKPDIHKMADACKRRGENPRRLVGFLKCFKN